MKSKHIFVPALDVGETLPFTVHKTKNLKESLAEQERAKQALIVFMRMLEKQYGKSIYYMGMDIIATKSYERFIFEDGGFLEIMIEEPVALNAHFVHAQQARKFRDALRKTLALVLPRGVAARLFIKSIHIQTESDDSFLTRWKRFSR